MLSGTMANNVMADVSPRVRTFLNEHVSSIAQLEALLFLRCAPEKAWSSSALSLELRSQEAWLSKILTDLCLRGMIECLPEGGPRFRYKAATSELDRLIGEVAQEYVIHRVRIIEIVYNKPSDAIQAFSDAFDLRKGEQRG